MITQRLSLASLMIVLILPVSPIRAQQLSQNAAPEFVPQMGPDKSCVRALAFSPDRKWLVSAGEDGQILLWDAASNRLSARLLISVDAKEWLVVGDDGRFDGTDGGIRKLAAWRVQNQLVSLDSLPAEFRIKGLLQKVLSGQAPSTNLNLNTALDKLRIKRGD